MSSSSSTPEEAVVDPTDLLDCAATRVVNTSGVRKHFSVLPPHGRTLAAGESVEIFGDIYAFIAASKPGIRARRDVESLHDLLETGELQIAAIPTATCGGTLESSSSA